MDELRYENFIRARITELRIKKDVSEHKMSLELGKSGSYIRGITSGASLPSLRELLNIINYFEITPVEFFMTLSDDAGIYIKLCERLRYLSEADLEKVNAFIGWISKSD